MTRDALLLIAALSFAPRTGGAQLNGPLTIALRPYAGTALRTVDVVVGQHTRPFLFDTGAGFTVLTPDAVADAGCTPFGEVVGFRADGQRLNMQRCGPVPLRLGGYETTEEIGVFDLNALLGKDAPPVGGLVGLSSFGGRAITLDLAHDRVTVETPRSLADRVAGMHRIQLRLARGAGGDIVPFIQVRAHTGTLWLEVDSGNNGPVFLAPHAMAQLALKDSAGGRMTTGLDVVGLGTIAVHAAQRNLVFDGQLNPAFLRQIVLTIDLATGRAWAARAGDERSSESDSLDIIQLEHEWLETRDSVALDSILGDDFLHPVSPGVVIDKRANIAWLLAHPIPADVVERFRSIAVRLYGTAAIANGAVSKLDSTGRETSRFLFTDVFVRRRGRWVAVNAQETAVSVPAPH